MPLLGKETISLTTEANNKLLHIRKHIDSAGKQGARERVCSSYQYENDAI
ncbi:hypothetical protein FDUTEX481_01437 [Tolypothrix sp. PCC 7601]|nr:hypothetical protein FDUTEX481_01437 [Tolypothrix sp. PCC 7601]